MRVNKRGNAPIPAAAWRLAAGVHREVAAELAALLELGEIDDESTVAAVMAELRQRHADEARRFEVLASEVKRGRPKSDAAVNALMVLMSKTKKRTVGAPVKFGDRYDIKTFHLVEEHRALLAASNQTKPTIRKAVESLNVTIADQEGFQKISYKRATLNHTLSSYQRGKRLVKADQKVR